MTAYAGMADAWADGRRPGLRADGPAPPRQGAGAAARCRALDAGAGSGVAGRALRERGARVVAADRELDMAAHNARRGARRHRGRDRAAVPGGSFDVGRGGVRRQPPARPGGGLASSGG